MTLPGMTASLSRGSIPPAAGSSGKARGSRLCRSQAEAIYRRAGDLGGLAAVELGRGNLEGNLGQSAPARAAFARARDLYVQAGNPAGEAVVLAALGDLEKATFRYAEARAAFDQAENAFERAGNPATVKHVLLGIEVEATMPVSEAASRKRLAEAQLVYAQIDDPVGIGRVNHIRAQLEAKLGRPMAAFAMLSEAQTQYGAGRRPDLYARIGVELGLAQAALGYPEPAKEGLTAAIDKATPTDDKATVVAGYAALGAVERLMGEFPEAREAYGKAKATADAAGNKAGAAHALTGLGITDVQNPVSVRVRCPGRNLPRCAHLGRRSGKENSATTRSSTICDREANEILPPVACGGKVDPLPIQMIVP